MYLYEHTETQENKESFYPLRAEVGTKLMWKKWREGFSILKLLVSEQVLIFLKRVWSVKKNNEGGVSNNPMQQEFPKEGMGTLGFPANYELYQNRFFGVERVKLCSE